VLVLETVLETAPEELGIDDDTWSLDTGALVLVMETAPEELGIGEDAAARISMLPVVKITEPLVLENATRWVLL
jgi:hypothetical protein